MVVKKHQLTVGTDKIKGSAGKDLFLAGRSPPENYDLSSIDRLDGGKGLDTIRAEIGDMMGAPFMKNIERGIFEMTAEMATLDLKRAGKMNSLTIKSLDDVASIQITIDNASAVDTIRVIGGDQNDDNVITGMDTTVHKTLSLSLIGASSDLGCMAAGVKPFKAVELTLVDAMMPTIWGSALSARDVTIRSMGTFINQATFDPGQYMGTTRHLTIEGKTQFILIDSGSEIFQHLYSVDLTGMKASSQISVGGEKLTSIVGGVGNDALMISQLGGSAKHKAEINLGGGVDGVLLLDGCYDAKTQRFNGGKGWDSITFDGAVEDIAKGIRNFEAIYFYQAVGKYDLSGLTVDYGIGSTAGSVTLDHVMSGSIIGLLGDSTSFQTINVENAAGSKKESVLLSLAYSMSNYGNSVVGLVASDLSELNLEVLGNNQHTFYLTTIGSATDGATLNISGTGALSLTATNGSWSYIDRIEITNTGGVDLSGLEDGTRALLGTGATIIGGAGDDVLVGSISADTISTGGGNNTVLGSLNFDAINLEFESGADKIIYRASNESSYGLGYDTITNFNSFDVIDVSAFADVAFVGNFADNASGIAALSTTNQRAFFNTTTDTLYIDIDHDKALGLNHDMQIVLTGLASFAGFNLVS